MIIDKDGIMTPLAIVISSFLAGSVVTGTTFWAIKSKNEKQDIELIVDALESEFQKAQASAVQNLTEPDLLKIPCSMDYISQYGDLLCREMFCRMNRQGGGQNSGGGAGATESECSSISRASINQLKVDKCMQYWQENAGQDQNSQYSRCITIFSQIP